MTARENMKSMIFISLFAALMVVGAYIKIPLGPVPLVLTNFFIVLAGILLGPVRAMVSAGIYLLLGFIGLPVFSGGGGPGYFAGPTGGYLIGYLLGAGTAGLVSGIGKIQVIRAAAGSISGFLVIYAAGLPWLKHVLQLSWPKTLTLGLTPFIPGDLIKAAAITALTLTLHKTIPEYLPARKSS